MQNGVVGSKNGHLTEIAHTLMFTRNVTKTFWSDAIQIVTYLMNKMPSHVLSFISPTKNRSPKIFLFSLPLKTFGCICYVHISKSDHTKLDQKTLKCVFLGYGADHKGYKCFHPLTHRKFVSQDMTFFEFIIFFSLGKTSLQGESSGNELSSSTIPLPIPVLSFHFDSNGVSRKGETKLKSIHSKKEVK